MHSLDFSREIIDALDKYRQLIIKWNKTINLISKNSLEEIWERHIVDSLQLLKFINNKDIHLVDIGSGGGFPGIVLSIAGVKKVTLIESDIRKSAFLFQASHLSSNKVEILTQRSEEVHFMYDILTARAFANLDKIFKCTQNIKIKDKYLLLKGENYNTEINDALVNWSFNYNVYNSESSKNGKVLEINNLANIECQQKLLR